MKKIIAITAMAAAAAALSFADEPVADVKVAELSGNAAVTWGVDLDTGKTGFKNTEEAKLKVNFTNEGTKKTEGEGIWAEIELKGKSLYAENGAIKDGTASVENAKLHFGPVYVGIKSGDTVYGKYKLVNAIRSADSDNALTVADVADPSHTQGIVAGYNSNLFDVAVDFRSKPVETKTTTTTTKITYTWGHPDGTNGYKDIKSGSYAEWTAAQTADATLVLIDTYATTTSSTSTSSTPYANDYGLAAETTLKFVPGLSIGVGVDYQFDAKALGLGANASYKLSMGDKFYLQPSVAFTMAKIDNANPTMELGAGVLLGWGATADANAGVYYLDNDNAKKVTPGVGVAAKITSLTNNPVIQIVPSLYTGDIIPGLTAGVLAEINAPTAPNSKVGFGVAGGVKYALKATDAITITPQAGMRFANGATLPNLKDKCYGDNGKFNSDIVGTNADNTLMNVKVGADVSGLINNTTFSVDWTSRNLLSNNKDNGQIGTINLTCKISM